MGARVKQQPRRPPIRILARCDCPFEPAFLARARAWFNKRAAATSLRPAAVQTSSSELRDWTPLCVAARDTFYGALADLGSLSWVPHAAVVELYLSAEQTGMIQRVVASLRALPDTIPIRCSAHLCTLFADRADVRASSRADIDCVVLHGVREDPRTMKTVLLRPDEAPQAVYLSALPITLYL